MTDMTDPTDTAAHGDVDVHVHVHAAGGVS